MIEFNNLTKIFDKNKPQEVKALVDISFKIFEGEIVNIIGRTGSGKTTLSNILLGISKPTNGSFKIDELVIDNKTRKRKLRLITNKLLSSFQYPTHQIFTKSVKEEIMFNSRDEEYMNELIKKFNFPIELLDKSPFKISSGQKRKVILISLLMQKPNILVFDEATAFLDAQSRKEFIELIKKINKEFKTTIIFISHNIQDVKSLSQRTILLNNGKIEIDGKTNEVVKKYLENEYGK